MNLIDQCNFSKETVWSSYSARGEVILEAAGQLVGAGRRKLGKTRRRDEYIYIYFLPARIVLKTKLKTYFKLNSDKLVLSVTAQNYCLTVAGNLKEK